MPNRKVICGCKWALFALALTWGSGHAAYLPVIGPAPMRFAPTRKPPANASGKVAANSVANTFAPSGPVSISDWIAGVVLPDFLKSAWPLQIPRQPGDHQTYPASDSGGGQTPAVRMVYPAELVPFFNSGTPAPSNRPTQVILEFEPPNKSSTAVYIKQ